MMAAPMTTGYAAPMTTGYSAPMTGGFVGGNMFGASTLGTTGFGTFGA